MYFEERGDRTAPAIVFIHGGGVGGWMWEKQLEYFSAYHCLIPDLPEHGKSVNEGHISIKESACRIAELIEKHASTGRADVVGHSLGAKVLVELLGKRPELVKHAVVASALYRPVPLMMLTHKMSVYKLTVKMLKSGWFLNRTVKQFRFPGRDLEAKCAGDFRGQTAESLYRVYDELYRGIVLPDGLGGADVPTLAVAGEKEFKAMKASVDDIVHAMPNAKGLIIKNGLHTYPWAMHREFNRIIDEWINR